MRNHLTTVLFLLVWIGFGMVNTAYAEEEMTTSERIQALSIQGAEHFSAGDFQRAADSFEQAYDLEPIPNLLFNIGRCYEQLEEWEKAKDNFQRFLGAPDIDDETRQYAENKVDKMNQHIEEEREAERLAQQKREEEEARRREEEERARAAEEARRRAMEEASNTPAFAAIGAGGGLLVGGVLMGMRANGNAERLDDTTLAYEERVAARNSARNQGLVADAFYVTGAAATAVGVYMLLSSDDFDDEPDMTATTGFSPWFGLDGAGVELHVGF